MTPYDFTGRTLNQRYVLQRQIGAGAFATVYMAHDLRMFKRKVAIKVLNPERRLDPGNVERFIQEVKVAARLDGPYRDRVVKIIDQGRCDVEQPPLLYLVMEHVEGITLQSLLRPGGPDQPRRPLPWPQAASIVRELLKALATMHDCGVVHRDIKPGNVILEQRPDGDFLKLLDLGIVKILPDSEMSGDNPMTHPEFVLGTPRYMAPEQFHGPSSDPRVDLYAAGIMLYEFLTGDVPLRWVEKRAPGQPYEALPPSHIHPIGNIPPALDALVLRAIAFEPARRFPSAKAFAQALSEVLHAHSVEGQARARSRAPSAEHRVMPVTTTSAAAAVETEPAVDGRDLTGSLLRWWTIAATTCTSMVFVFAFASLLRRDESRPTLALESDEPPMVVEAPRPRAVAPAPAAPTPAPPVVAEPAAQPEAEPAPRVPAPAETTPPPAPRPRRPRPPAPEPEADPSDELMPIPRRPR